jgi:hypothetical protein
MHFDICFEGLYVSARDFQGNINFACPSPTRVQSTNLELTASYGHADLKDVPLCQVSALLSQKRCSLPFLMRPGEVATYGAPATDLVV